MDGASCFGQLDANTGREKQGHLTQSKNPALQSSCSCMGREYRLFRNANPENTIHLAQKYASTLTIDLSAVLFMYVYIYIYIYKSIDIAYLSRTGLTVNCSHCIAALGHRKTEDNERERERERDKREVRATCARGLTRPLCLVEEVSVDCLRLSFAFSSMLSYRLLCALSLQKHDVPSPPKVAASVHGPEPLPQAHDALTGAPSQSGGSRVP